MGDLKSKTAIGTAWLMIDRFGQQVIILTVFVIMARLLAVEDYALVGMLSIFVAFSTLLIDSGFRGALVREKEVTAIDYSTIFVFNLVVSLSIYIVLFFAAPLIADFYKQPELVALARFIFLGLPINALGIVQNISLAREVDFKLSTIVSFFSLLLSGAVAVVMALLGMGVWALAAQSVLFTTLKVSLLWICNRLPVSFNFQPDTIKKHWSYTSNMLLTSFLNATSNNVYSAVIGRQFPKLDMGYYTQANKAADIPYDFLNGPIQGVAFASFSKVHEDEERFVRVSRKGVRTLSFMLFPVMLGAICVIHPLVSIALGSKWENMIPFFQLICVANIFSSLSTFNNTFLSIKRLSNILLRLESVKVGLLFAVMFFTFSIDIMTMLWGLIAVRAVYFFVNGFVVGKKTGYSLWMQLKDMFPYLSISLLMGVLVYSWTFVVENLYLLLLLQVVTGLVVYIIANKMLGSKVYEDARDMLLGVLKRKVEN
ncbi:MAG: lipopolysaccharide biosynthesis protein [Prevotellaceae bacterium]|nr:lipopolysaccharide biosynthesis protein [Prevotellaceae bacterium]